ncbi:YhgE/Pip domain-containing protein [Cytobacillus citreus]|nr:YhgE/Pip domain-containing protein [Cytobacillus citreus]
MMKTIFRIYRTDLKNIYQNWAVFILIAGLTLLPSLYAWFNIEASWDPYGHTSDISIAVSNKDKGANIRGSKINVGDELVSSLKTDENFNWVFIDEKEAIKGVERGKYYASITVPENFSEKITTVLTDDPEKPTLSYYVNEKINAVAPKITSTGATGLVEQISKNFVKTANGAIFKVFNEIGIELERDLPTIERVKYLIFELEKQLPTIRDTTNKVLDDVEKANQVISTTQEKVKSIAVLSDEGVQLAESFTGYLNKATLLINNSAPLIKENLVILKQTADSTNQLTDFLLDNQIPTEEKINFLQRHSKRLEKSVEVIDDMISFFEHLTKSSSSSSFDVELNRLQEVKKNFMSAQVLLKNTMNLIENGEPLTSKITNQINQFSESTSELLNKVLDNYDNQTVPNIDKQLQKTKSLIEDSTTALKGAKQSLPDVKSILGEAQKGITFGTKELQKFKEDLPEIERKLKEITQRIRAFEANANIKEIIDLLKNDMKKESDFFAEPVLLKEHKLFPIPNYGSAMSPFFTTLSLWVGAMLLVSLLSIDTTTNDSIIHFYFGKFLIFLTIALLQALIVTLGDIFLLKTFVVDKLWFVLFALFMGGIFMLMVFTFVFLFGNVGKALGIVLLVLQISGSGGTFPIQVVPEFFQAINPFLPFTYAISMMREAVGGIIWDIVIRDAIILSLFGILTILLGVFLKKPANRLTEKFKLKIKESSLIH